jgi:hypothetical protein
MDCRPFPGFSLSRSRAFAANELFFANDEVIEGIVRDEVGGVLRAKPAAQVSLRVRLLSARWYALRMGGRALVWGRLFFPLANLKSSDRCWPRQL